MRIIKDKPEDSMNLREQAEKRAKQPIVEFRKQRREDTAELIHELRVHQIELEIQNEELRNAQLELADSRNKYCELYDFAPIGYFTLNKEGLIVGANLTGAAFLGEERDNLLKSKFSHFVTPGSQDDFYLHHKQVVESGTTQSCEVKLRRKDGTEFPAQLVSVAIAEQKSKYDQFRMAMIDITEQKKAENARRESEERYRSLFDNMLEGFAYCQMIFAEGRPQDLLYLNVNNAFEKLTGLKNVVGRKITEVIPGIKEANPELIEIYGRVSLTGKPERFEDYFEPLKAWLSISVYSPEKGYFVAIFENITERKRAEETLRESEDKFRHVFAYSAIGKSITSLSGEMHANKALCKMLGYSEKELKVKKWQDITHPDDVEDSQKAIDSILSGQKELVQLFKRYICKNGSVVWADVSTSLRRDNEGKPLYLMTSMVNITKRKQAEEKLQEERNLLRTLIDHMPDGVYIKDKEGRILGYNKSLAESWETRGRNDITGKTDLDLFEPELALVY